MTRTEIIDILNTLGSRGLVGYDMNRQCYFSRQLPFEAAQIEQLQPRIKKARKIESTSGVQVILNTQSLREARVLGARSSTWFSFRKMESQDVPVTGSQSMVENVASALIYWRPK